MNRKRRPAHSRTRPVACPLLSRVISIVLEPAELTGHLKVVAHLLARHQTSPVFSAAERYLLLVIGGRARLNARHRWALLELSRRVALLDLPEVLDA
ncbi:MAG: hypothetical protein AB7O44_32445 [Hyphomicrobiaceae bacterium]